MSARSATNHTPLTRSYRCAVACQACRQRKVRCSLAVTGKPCIGCTQDRAECIVVPKQRRKTKRTHLQANRHCDPRSMRGSDARNQIPSDHESNPSIDSSTLHIELQIEPDDADQIPRQFYPALESDSREGGVCSEVDIETSSLEQSQEARITTIRTEDEEGDFDNEERSGFEIATAAFGQCQRNGQIPFYSGDQTGPAYTLDICSPERPLPTHFLIPSHARSSLSDADRSYLKAKGVLTLPKTKSCESLLRAYLRHVHPIVPVIEVDHILEYQHNGRLHDYNLLLLWSIFSAAVNFVSPEVYQQEGYTSRKEMKASMYSRAKCMYTISEGTDKIILIQSSLLMGFWISERDEYLQPWSWTGAAINLCQMLGLHRNPDSSKFNCVVTDRQRCLWRRLWWSSFYRDRWLGMSFGRPLRINLVDCDVPTPTAADLLIDVVGIPESTSAGFLPNDLPKLASYWVTLIELSKQLGAVIAMNYQSQKPKPTIQQFESVEAEILQCTLPVQYDFGLNSFARFHSFHVHLHYQALLICLYRPYEAESPAGLDAVEQEDWQHRMRLKASNAASQISGIFNALAEDGLLLFAGPMTPKLLAAAMQTHMQLYKSADPLTKRIRLHKLEMCMLIMEELQKIYTVASIYRGIFLKALQQICPSYQSKITAADQTANSVPESNSNNKKHTISETAPSQLAAEPFDNTNNCTPSVKALEQDAEFVGDFMDSLMDETSIFSFGGFWNTM
ncbi:fungal-specific transcription factor domain-containing protein [Trichoderma velutinum]